MMRRSAFGKMAVPGASRSRSDAPARQFPLFKMVRIMALTPRRQSVDLGADKPEGGDDEALSPTQGTRTRRRGTGIFGSLRGTQTDEAASASSGQGIAIVNAAVAGCVGHAFVALVLSDDRLLVRYSGDSGFPVVRQFQWFHDPQKRVLALDFNPTAEWLVVVCADLSTWLLPVFALMHDSEASFVISLPKITGVPLPPRVPPTAQNGEAERSAPAAPAEAPSTSWFRLPSLVSYAAAGIASTVSAGSLARAADDPDSDLGPLDDATLALPPTRGVRSFTATSCQWWRTWQKSDILIVGTQQGAVLFIDLRLRLEVQSIRIKAPVSRLEILEDAAAPFRYLLIHVATGGAYQLALEQENEDHVIETLLTSGGRAPFLPVPLQRFAVGGLALSAQRYKQAPVVAVRNPQNHKLEIYDADLDKYPLYVYQLFPDITDLVLTDKFIFAGVSAGGSGGARLSVVSNIIAGTSGNPVYALDRKIKESIMQEFHLAPNETLLSVLRAFPVSRMMASKYRQGDGDVAPEGCLVVTNRAVYELRADVPAEQIFSALLSRDRQSADAIGKTMQLDIFRLYETAADQQFQAGNFDSALELYVMSNVRTSKLLDLFLHIDRVDIVLPYLLAILHDATAVPVGDRRKYADIVFRIYVQKLLQEGRRDGASTDVSAGADSYVAAAAAAAAAAAGAPVVRPSPYSDFKGFLLQNSDYDSGIALMELIKHGWSDLFFEVAHVRQIMPVALNILVNRGALYISRQHVKFLLRNAYAEALMSCSGGVLLRCMQPNDQVDIILSMPETAMARMYEILLLLPYLDEKRLRRVIAFMDPSKAKNAPPSQPPPPQSGKDQQSEERAELFLTVIIVLLGKKKAAAAGGPQTPIRLAPMAMTEPSSLHLSTLTSSPSESNTLLRPLLMSGRARRHYTFGTSPAKPSFADKRMLVGSLKQKAAKAAAAAEAAAHDDFVDVASTEKYLHAHLRSLLGAYRMSVLIGRCLQWHDWSTAAEIYEILHDWPLAMEYRLRAVAAAHGIVDDGEAEAGAEAKAADEEGRRRAPTAAAAADEAEEADAVIAGAFARIRKLQTSAIVRSVLTVVEYWHARRLDVARLEALLLAHVDVVAGTLGALAAHVGGRAAEQSDEASKKAAEANNKKAVEAAAMPALTPAVRAVVGALSPQLLLKVTQARLAALDEKRAKEHVMRVPESRLWSEIRANMDKELDRRPQLVVPTLSFPAPRADGGVVSADADTVAFTCSHHYSRREFVETQLPELRRRLELLPSGLPLTTKMITVDFLQARSHSACPTCLYNALRAECVKEMPELERSVRPWNV